MKFAHYTRQHLLVATAIAYALTTAAAYAEPADASAPATTAETPDGQNNGIAEGSDVIVTGTKANEIAPVTASLQTTQPQSIISRSFIEDSLPATADFNQIALIAPSVSNYGNANGTGLSESKAQIRGFQDGEYNVTYDGVPFGDTNDPTHHSNTFFPSNTVETLIVDRGPGNAATLGQATFGGNMNLFSRATRDVAGIEGKAAYGSFNTYLLRAVAQTGAIEKLGGTEAVFSTQWVKSDGARTYSPFRSWNVFGKVMVPLGAHARLTFLGTYNVNRFNQPDKDGATLDQIKQYGKYYSLNNDPTSQGYFGYNHTRKTTDFEIIKFEADLGAKSSFENRAYTYSYDNETLSGSDVTAYGHLDKNGQQIAEVNTVTLTPGAKAVAGVPGYTKTNKYRMYGDIAKVHLDFGFGTLTTGAWIEWSDTYRQQRDVDLVTMLPNYIEKKVSNPVTKAATPQNIKFDQNSNTNHTEEFVELELRPIPGLKITPGFKHVDFNRRIDATYNQTTRYAQRLSSNYSANLPFATANYAVTPTLSVYAQFAKGFLAPPLSVLYVDAPGRSTVEPEKSTNYQAGVVYHGQRLSIDADVYKIDFSNKFASKPDAVFGTIWFNQGSAQYKGIEGQITYAFPGGLAVFANGSRNYAKTNNPGFMQLQVANAPDWTGGLLFKHGPMVFSLIDKWTGRQWFTDPSLIATGDTKSFSGYDAYRSNGYNSAILSARYELGPVRFGVEVNNLFDSKRVTNINAGKTAAADQYFYQVGRTVTGDITVKF